MEQRDTFAMPYQQQDETEILENLFVAFAQTLLTHVEAWTTSGEQLQLSYPFYDFGDNSYQRGTKTRYDAGLLWHRHSRQDILTMAEADLCAAKHWEAGVFDFLRHLQIPETASDTFEQIRGLIIRDLLLPVLDVLNMYDTFHPTQDQILQSYRRFMDLWISSTIPIEVTFPLVNFNSDLQQKWKIGVHLDLAPFTSAEKTAIWNEEPSITEIRTRPIAASELMSIPYRLFGLRRQHRNNPAGLDNYQEVVSELWNVLTALRLFKEGDVGAPGIFERGHISSMTQSIPIRFLPSPTEAIEIVKA
jgi:hypothetical protein